MSADRWWEGLPSPRLRDEQGRGLGHRGGRARRSYLRALYLLVNARKLARIQPDAAADVGPHSNPSRSQMESFVKMWQRVVRAIDVVPTGPLSDYHTLPPNVNANGVRSQRVGA
jgi:hypothetical protein